MKFLKGLSNMELLVLIGLVFCCIVIARVLLWAALRHL